MYNVCMCAWERRERERESVKYIIDCVLDCSLLISVAATVKKVLKKVLNIQAKTAIFEVFSFYKFCFFAYVSKKKKK